MPVWLHGGSLSWDGDSVVACLAALTSSTMHNGLTALHYASSHALLPSTVNSTMHNACSVPPRFTRLSIEPPWLPFRGFKCFLQFLMFFSGFKCFYLFLVVFRDKGF